jgi:hypothetical protein
MRSRRLALLSLLAALAASLAVSATATAHEFSVEEKPLEKTEVEFFLTAPEGKFETKLAGLAENIECEEGLSNGFLAEKGKFSGEVKLDNCNLTSDTSSEEPLTGCAVSPVAFKFRGELINGTDGGVEGELKGEGTEEAFAEIVLSNNTENTEEEGGSECVLKGTYKIKGVTICSIPEVAIARSDHEFDCTSSDDKLKLKEEPVRMTVPFSISQASNEEWSAT